MGKISIQTDCGNAPRKLFIKDIYVAFANGNTDFLTNNIPQKIKWEILGRIKVTGQEDYI